MRFLQYIAIAPRHRRLTEEDRDYERIARSGLFDLNHYLIEAPDVVSDGADPLLHFCRFGCREGRRPNLYFDPVWYTDVYLSGQTGRVNALSHYIQVGERTGLRPVCYFEPDWYARAYELEAGSSALAHYLRHRRSQRYAPNALFDLAYYLERYGAEIGPNRDAFAHLLRYGAGRDLDCGRTFDARAYRVQHGLAFGPAAPSLPAHEACIPLLHCLDRQARDDRTGSSTSLSPAVP